MYELDITPFGEWRRYDIHNPANGNGFSLVPGKGATLLDLRFGGRQVLDGYSSPEELTIGKWGKSAVLFPFPNRLRDGRYNWQQQDYQFPINNADTGNAIHGIARAESFEVVRVELTTESAEVECRLEYAGTHPGYPFPCTLDLTFSMSNRRDFNVAFFLKNHHSQAIPAGFGWHPYFRLCEQADAHLLHLPECEKVAIDERMIPTGEKTDFDEFVHDRQLDDTRLDNCFKVKKPGSLYRLGLAGSGGRLSVVASASSFPFFQVFTPPHRESIALEPMTCNVDAFNNGEGLVTVPAGGDWLEAFRVEYYDH